MGQKGYNSDVKFDVCRMINTGKHPKVKKVFEIKILLKLKLNKKIFISFSSSGKSLNLNINCYSDVTYVSLEDGYLLSSFIIFIGGNLNKMDLMCWSSKNLHYGMKNSQALETLHTVKQLMPMSLWWLWYRKYSNCPGYQKYFAKLTTLYSLALISPC